MDRQGGRGACRQQAFAQADKGLASVQIENIVRGVASNPDFNVEFRCFRGCAGSWPVTQAIYSCPTCGGLLEVHHDMDALKRRSGAPLLDLR